ncbi:MAG: hypothetical protein LBC18_04140 [Opitutaceae bacterium]|jgi:2-keto-3-deoxy-L-rhamnonate aldolase RhmA|nr:hypothetical protein [Opitutaceae bacterium]
MHASLVKQRLRSGKVARVTTLCNPVAMLPAHAARAGFHAIWLDTEHNTWDPAELRHLIARHHLAGIDCVVRAASRLPRDLYHLLEDGATGIMAPFVNTAADARALVRALKFPPLGERGLDGAGFDNNYCARNAADYTRAANAEALLVAQIETPEALANVNDIAAAGVDVLFIGPGDLSLRLGCPLDWTIPAMRDAQNNVAAAARRHGAAWGRPCADAADIAAAAALGAQYLAHGSDFNSLAAGIAACAKIFTDALGSD